MRARQERSLEQRDDEGGARGLIRYAPIFVAVVGFGLILDGAAKRLGAGLCDQCSGDQGPGNRLIAFGLGLLILAVVITIVRWVNSRPDDGGDD